MHDEHADAISINVTKVTQTLHQNVKRDQTILSKEILTIEFHKEL